jgi:hypothetical protein
MAVSFNLFLSMNQDMIKLFMPEKTGAGYLNVTAGYQTSPVVAYRVCNTFYRKTIPESTGSKCCVF